MKEHILKQGEKLSELSAIYGIPVCMIVRANCFTSPEQIFAGLKVMVPPRDYCTGAKVEVERRDTYVAGQGETIFDISNKCGVTMREILKENNIGANDIFEGKELIIPKVAADLFMYNTKMGESYDSIANKFGIDKDELVSQNGNNLYPGMQIYMPNAKSGISSE